MTAVLEPTGIMTRVEGVDVHRTLPQPIPGEHTWGAILMFGLSAAEIRTGRVSLTVDRIIGGPDLGCLTCEQPWSDALASQPCPGEPRE